MKATRLTDNLVQVTRAHFVNAFLVREDDGFTLVDTTLGGGADKLIAVARQQGAEIRRIALTHGHSDHAGSLDALREQLGSEVEVLVPDLDVRIWAGEPVVEGKPRGSWPHPKTLPNVRLVGGERIGSLEVIATPGHTPGHVAFRDTRDNSLLAGDTLTSYVRVDIPNRPGQPFPLAAMGTQDRIQVVESARKLRALEPSLLVVGHGPATPSPLAAIDRALARVSG